MLLGAGCDQLAMYVLPFGHVVCDPVGGHTSSVPKFLSRFAAPPSEGVCDLLDPWAEAAFLSNVSSWILICSSSFLWMASSFAILFSRSICNAMASRSSSDPCADCAYDVWFTVAAGAAMALLISAKPSGVDWVAEDEYLLVLVPGGEKPVDCMGLTRF
jgi:hypothetical protein